MKTAVQELLDDLLSGKITDTLAKSDYYLEKHKQQIIDAWENGFNCNVSAASANEYYSEIFKND